MTRRGEPLLLAGIVIDHTGRPVANARVALAAAPTDMPDIAALTGEDGQFSFGVPVAGRYQLQAFGDDTSGSATIEVVADRLQPVRVVIRVLDRS